MGNETGVSNNQTCRGISDKLDKHYFNNHPAQRALVHGVYHDTVGVLKAVRNNTEGANAEFARAKEQFSRVKDGSPKGQRPTPDD